MRSALTTLGVFIRGGCPHCHGRRRPGGERSGPRSRSRASARIWSSCCLAPPPPTESARDSAVRRRLRLPTRRPFGVRMWRSAKSAISFVRRRKWNMVIRTGRLPYLACQSNYPPITNWEIAAGRGLTRDDESSAALVALIGQTVRPPALRSVPRLRSGPRCWSKASRCG